MTSYYVKKLYNTNIGIRCLNDGAQFNTVKPIIIALLLISRISR